ncbi:hypothetical protein EDD98_5052 [Streptomyces sp. PanSC19]|uniref:hypothetical protein n=1 Tax=Streptomyces sp. PanSC19 TaxID=1520455 RepID=UPI000FC23528|nr:hypothetical protein [Streptomyces sp. PanSC19]ROQ35971.1 hypothetical protein EDD98_5052 [Streptomyces sp. PanSC19]
MTPAHDLKYVAGSLSWSGVIPMAVIGVSRSFGTDVKPYLNSHGLKVYAELEEGSIVDALGHYPGLTWKKMAKPEYENLNTVPGLVTAVNRIDLGSAATPTVPGFIAQGDAGVLEGTFGDHPGIGTGDGVMVAGDVRSPHGRNAQVALPRALGFARAGETPFEDVPAARRSHAPDDPA